VRQRLQAKAAAATASDRVDKKSASDA
jgi:hypothetical protein